VNKMNNKTVAMAATLLVVVGALNWGLVGLGWLMGGADWNAVHMLLGSWQTLEAVVYLLVGVAGVWVFWDSYTHMKKK
jgi:uncharacterized membrane protein YuzA (DUF378 family)